MMLAKLLGFQAQPVATDGGFRIADASHPEFGEIVPVEAQTDQTFTRRDDSALVLLDNHWVAAENVATELVEAWKDAKTVNSGRDNRVLTVTRDTRGKRFKSEHDAVPMFTEVASEDWIYKGPRLVLEFFLCLLAAGQTLMQHHFEWVKKSGVNAEGAIAREHAHISEVLRVAVTIDQLDLSNLCSTELMLRRMVQIETAVKRNPKVPDFGGLDMMLESKLDSTGAAVTAAFNDWLKTQQQTEAQIQKQGRLLREERTAAKKAAGGSKTPGAGD
jgi:hypothetical protein